MSVTRRASFLAMAGAGAAAAACAQQTSEPAAPAGLSTEALSAWLDRYGAAWQAKDAAAAGLLFTEDATYHEMPFDAPFAGRAAIEAYWARVTAPQSDIQFSYEVVAASGDTGVAHWSASFNAGGAAVTLDGVFVLLFADDLATVRSLREWWHVQSAAPQ